jgi:hypothetical protein
MRNPRRSLAKAWQRLRPQSAALAIECVDRLIESLTAHQFGLAGKPSDGGDWFWDRLNFERNYSSSAFQFISVGFANNGDLKFGVSFGIRDYAEPHEWHLAGNLSRRRTTLWRTCDLGAVWFLPNGEKRFIRDWHFLMKNIPNIIHFLETGEAKKNISDREIFPKFEPRKNFDRE